MSMDLPSVEPLPTGPRETISADSPEQRLAPLSPVAPIQSSKPKHILDFDCETIAAGFADPNWVPQKITCVGWSWVGSDKVETRISTAGGLFGSPERRAEMLEPLLAAIHKADMLIGHNLLRFDLPIVNAECMRLGLDTLPAKLVHDTMRIVKSKGFKKGQDNLGRLLNLPVEKMTLDWQGWQDAYDEKGWKTIRQRCASDIVMHKMLYEQMSGWLKPPIFWRP